VLRIEKRVSAPRSFGSARLGSARRGGVAAIGPCRTIGALAPETVTANQNATVVVRRALAGSGVELISSCGADAYDAAAPDAFHSGSWLSGARGLVVAGSAGPALWRSFREVAKGDPTIWDQSHPLDQFVATVLSRADVALGAAGVRFRRFEAAFQATPRVDFVAIARLVGLGSPGPFGMLIHPEYGPWWALRGAWLVDADVEPPPVHRPPCAGCHAPCVGGWPNAGGIAMATVQARSLCVVGQASRYDDDQIAYHYDRAATVVRLRRPVP
jgi:hypothetical protein